MSGAEMNPAEFAQLERKAAGPAAEILDGLLAELGNWETDVLRQVAEYREAIHPGDWFARCVREYLESWR